MIEMAWQCRCGSLEYSDMEPEECLSCGEIGKFAQLPSELVEERMKDQDNDMDLSMEDEMAAEMGIKPKSSKLGKSRPKLKKPSKPKSPSRRKK